MQLEVNLSNEDVELIGTFLQLHLRPGQEDLNTHGKLDMNMLATMLLEDVALAVRRPGSWEGANMGQVLTSHGYRVPDRSL